MATFTTTQTSVEFTDTDGAVSFTATRPAVTFTAAYQSVTGGGGGATDLDDLTDVTITAAATGEGLRYNGTVFVDHPMSARWAATHAGAFGPGFDDLVPADVFGAGLSWGPDYYLYQAPDGTYYTEQASNGDTIICASYLLGAGSGYAGDITQEGIWTLTAGAWVRNSTQLLPGESAIVEPLSGIPWTVGLEFVKLADGRMEQSNAQYLRDVIATSTVVESYTTTATLDATTSGAHAGFGVCNATSGAFTVTLVPVADDRGRSVLFVKTDATGNAVSIDADGTETINGSTSAVTLTTQWDWVRLTSDGTGWVATRGGAGGGTVDVVSNVAQDRLLGRTSSGSGDSEELTAAQSRTLLGLSIEPTRRIPLGANYSGPTGMYGSPPWDIQGSVTAEAYAAGEMRGIFCDIGGAPTLATICFEVSASSLTAGQSVTIACYALNTTTGLPTGTPVWTETQVVGTTTGVYQKATTNALPAGGCFLAILNPSTNAGSVTVYAYRPTGPFMLATRSITVRPALYATGLSSAPDVSAYKVGASPASSVWGYWERGPLLLLR